MREGRFRPCLRGDDVASGNGTTTINGLRNNFIEAIGRALAPAAAAESCDAAGDGSWSLRSARCRLLTGAVRTSHGHKRHARATSALHTYTATHA